MSNTTETQSTTTIPMLTAHNLGASLKSLVFDEIKALQNVWQKLSERQQNMVVERVEKQIKCMTASAVNTLASGEMPRLEGYIEQVNFKDKIKATVILSGSNDREALMELVELVDRNPCQLVLTDSEQFTSHMDLIEVDESDQPDMLESEDNLLWCVVVPIRQGNESIVPAPSHEMAETLAKKIRKTLISYDNDLASSVYAKPWNENKASHARMLKNNCWSSLVDWYHRLEKGEEDAEPVAFITHVEEEAETAPVTDDETEPKSSTDEDMA